MKFDKWKARKEYRMKKRYQRYDLIIKIQNPHQARAYIKERQWNVVGVAVKGIIGLVALFISPRAGIEIIRGLLK